MKDYDEKLFGDSDDEILDGEIAEPIDDDLDFGDFDDDLNVVDNDFSQNDDRIDRVLDEIAELKRNMSSGSSSKTYSSPFSSSSSNTPSDVAMYNEISRLRDELSKTQHSQSMHMELNRMKEDMERETKSNEEKLLSEIKNLQKQIKSLKDGDDAADLEESQRAYADSEIASLVKINQSLVDYTKAFGAKLEADINKLKESMPNIPAIEELTAKLAAIKDMPLRAAATSIPTPHVAKESDKHSLQSDMTEAMRRLIEIKLQLGRLNKDEYERELVTLSLYDSLTAAKSAVYSSVCGVAEKLDTLRKLENELTVADECYVYDIVVKYNELIDALLAQQITQDGVDVFSRLSSGDKITSSLSGEIRATAGRFVALVGEMGDGATGGAIDRLPEIVGLKNKLQGNRCVADNDALYDDVLTLNSDLVFINDAAAAEKCAAEIKERIKRVCYLPYSEFVTYPHMEYDKRPGIITTRTVAQEFVDEMLDGEELKTSEEAIGALTSAVNLLRSEIADGAMLSGGAVDSITLQGLMSDISHIKSAIDSFVGAEVDPLVETENEDISKLLAEVKTLHSEVNTLSESSPSSSGGSSTPDEVNLFLSEIVSLRDEVQSYKDEISGVIERLDNRTSNGSDGSVFTPTSENADNTGAMILDELTGIRADIAGYTDELEAVKTAIEEMRSGDSFRTMVSDDGTYLSAPVVSDGSQVLAELDDIKSLLNESAILNNGDKLISVRDELLKAVNGISATPELDDGKLNDIVSSVESIKQQLSDLQIYETVGSPSAENTAVLSEIASLRDMLADFGSSETTDISYLINEISALKTSLENKSVNGEQSQVDITELKASISDLKAIVIDRTDDSNSAVINDISETIHKIVDEPDYSVMNEILALREEFQLMKERLERSALLASDNSESKLVGEVRELKELLTATNTESNKSMSDELAQLRLTVAEQRQTQDSILGMLKKMLEKQDKLEAKIVGKQPPHKEEKKERDDTVLKEIENIKYTLGVMQGNEDKDADADLEASIGRLKAELSQMAGIVEVDHAPRVATASPKKKKSPPKKTETPKEEV